MISWRIGSTRQLIRRHRIGRHVGRDLARQRQETVHILRLHLAGRYKVTAAVEARRPAAGHERAVALGLLTAEAFEQPILKQLRKDIELASFGSTRLAAARLPCDGDRRLIGRPLMRLRHGLARFGKAPDQAIGRGRFRRTLR